MSATASERALFWAKGWNRLLNAPTRSDAGDKPQRGMKLASRAIEACLRLRRATLEAQPVLAEGGASTAESTEPEARLSIEEGTLCIRNSSGWLLWSRDLAELGHGVSVEIILDEVAKHHQQWLEARRSAQ